ncbi:glycine cleavage system protein H [Paenibacillus sedimenti]|uniref:Glycine cleavage system protein H n=1 Tax=Paenibacillus sedimenti TaxID=2770274 RepID=A0A926KL82_9BACL|nr:glycine cleavage system protein H [Paenibacillus sedimenti]MBD0379862.1 glycine cleavage system protein H [Paenibacillus sedimenti]
MSVPAQLKYTRTHFWIRLEGDQAVIGLTEHGIAELGMILFIDLPERNAVVKQGDFIGSVETVADDEHDLLAPLSGKVTAVNMLLEKATLLLHESTYDKGWLFTIHWNDELELEKLWDAKAYTEEFQLE